MMRAFVFALATSVTLAYRDYTQSYVQVDSDLDDDLQFDEPVELPEVDADASFGGMGMGAAMKKRRKYSQVNTQPFNVGAAAAARRLNKHSQANAQPQASLNPAFRHHRHSQLNAQPQASLNAAAAAAARSRKHSQVNAQPAAQGRHR